MFQRLSGSYNGGMDPYNYSSPPKKPKKSPHNPSPHSLLSTREDRVWVGV